MKEQQPVLEVCLSPLLFPLYEAEEKIVVVIDVLRATSTISMALHHGAKEVIPVSSVEDCLTYKNNDGFILAAERNGMVADGFEFGNSPFSYMNGVIKNKTLVLTTTNGTKAIRDSARADKVTAGCFLNLNALCDWLMAEGKNVVLFCAGWKNQVNLEDTLFAGAVIEQLKSTYHFNNDPAAMSHQIFLNARNNLLEAICHSSHYQRLARLGLQKDIEFCMTPNQTEVIPVLEGNSMMALNKKPA